MIAIPFQCVLCDQIIKDQFGHNPDPIVGGSNRGFCCDSCYEKIIPAILAVHEARGSCPNGVVGTAFYEVCCDSCGERSNAATNATRAAYKAHGKSYPYDGFTVEVIL